MGLSALRAEITMRRRGKHDLEMTISKITENKGKMIKFTRKKALRPSAVTLQAAWNRGRGIHEKEERVEGREGGGSGKGAWLAIPPRWVDPKQRGRCGK